MRCGSTPPRRLRGRGVAGLAALALVFAVFACAEEDKGIVHPVDRLHYPVAITADPSGDFVYVVNSDFDVRYRTGSVVAIDLRTNELVPGSAIGIGQFGGEIALYETPNASHRLTGYVPSRASGALYWFTVTDNDDGSPELTCSEAVAPRSDDPASPDPIEECNGRYVIDSVLRPRLPRDDEGLSEQDAFARADESVRMEVGRGAFGVAVYRGERGVGDYLLLSNPRSGYLGVFGIGGEVPKDETIPGQPAPSGDLQADGTWSVVSEQGEPVFEESWGLLGGIYTTAVSPVDGYAYTTDKQSNVLVPFRIGEISDPDGAPRTWPEAADLTITTIVNSSALGDYGRGIAFSRDGTRAYIAYRNPSSLVLIDTAAEDDGTHRDRFLAAVDVGLRPSKVLLAPSGPGGSDLIYVVCFGDQQIYVVDPVTLDVVDIIDVDGGPYDMAIVRKDEGEQLRFRAYVTMFERDAVAVLELDRGSPFFHQITSYIRGVDDGGAH